MTVQGKYEYKLTIGAYSSETAGQLRLKKASIREGRSIRDFPKAQFDIHMTASALAIANEDVVRFWRREVGEATWGACFFRGIVTRTVQKRRYNEVSILAEGYMRELGKRSLPFIAWGNTHIVDKTYLIHRYLSGSNLTRLWVNLDAGLPAQVPLESVRYLRLEEMVTGGSSDGLITVYNVAANNRREIAQQFMARNGELRKIWVKGYVTAAGTQALKVAIQIDVGGAPSGVDITSYNLPSTAFGIGAANEGWAQIDYLANVTDPLKLVLQSGQPFWLVLSLANADATVYDLRYAIANPTPTLRTMKTALNGAAWAYNAAEQSLFYAIDYEGDWHECSLGYGHDYDVAGAVDPPLLIFYKTDHLAGELSGTYYFQGVTFPVLFEAQALVRVSYWKGTITYATVVTKWAQTLLSDLYNALDVSITEPANKQYCIQAEAVDGFAIFELMRQYAPMYARIYENAAGQVILEVRDERAPLDAVWNAIYAAGAERDSRTFVNGLDSPASPDRVRIVDFETYTELLSNTDVHVIKETVGNIVSVVGSGSVIRSGLSMMGGFGSKLVDSQAFADLLQTEGHTTRAGGRVVLSGIDQTMAREVFRYANQLLKLTDSKNGWAAKIFAIGFISWTMGGKGVSRVEIEFVDQVLTVYTPDETPAGPWGGGGVYDQADGMFQRLKGGLSAGFKSGADRRSTSSMVAGGVTDAPTSEISLAATSKRATEILLHEDATVTYNASKVWWIRMGTGTPPGGPAKALGAQVLEVPASYHLASGWAHLTAMVHPADVLPWRGAWPQVLTEVGIAWSNDIAKAGLTAVGAYSLGVPSGAKDIFAPPPELGPDRKIAVTIKISPAP